MRSPVMWSRTRGINDGIDESLRILLRQVVPEPPTLFRAPIAARELVRVGAGRRMRSPSASLSRVTLGTRSLEPQRAASPLVVLSLAVGAQHVIICGDRHTPAHDTLLDLLEHPPGHFSCGAGIHQDTLGSRLETGCSGSDTTPSASRTVSDQASRLPKKVPEAEIGPKPEMPVPAPPLRPVLRAQRSEAFERRSSPLYLGLPFGISERFPEPRCFELKVCDGIGRSRRGRSPVGTSRHPTAPARSSLPNSRRPDRSRILDPHGDGQLAERSNSASGTRGGSAQHVSDDLVRDRKVGRLWFAAGPFHDTQAASVAACRFQQNSWPPRGGNGRDARKRSRRSPAACPGRRRRPTPIGPARRRDRQS